MSEIQHPTEGIGDQEAFAAWTSETFQGMGQYAFKQGLIPEDSDGRCVWAIPHRIMLGRVWSKAEPGQAYWVITGQLPTDHIEASVADKARDAVRHFALKWQLQAARLQGDGPDDSGEAGGPDWADVAGSLQHSAEALYLLVEKDELWTSVQD